MCCGNRDFISSLLVSVDQQELKRLVALWSFPNKALFILFRKKGRSSHGKHLIPGFAAEHSSRAISKVVSAAERSALGCPHTHLHTEDQDCSRHSCTTEPTIFSYSNFPSSTPTLLVSMKLCVTLNSRVHFLTLKAYSNPRAMLPNPWISHDQISAPPTTIYCCSHQELLIAIVPSSWVLIQLLQDTTSHPIWSLLESC